MLKDHASGAIVATSDLARARTFYAETLGLAVAEDHGEVLLFQTGATRLAVYRSDFAGTNKANAVVWDAGGDVEAIAADLRGKGVTLDEYPEGFDRVTGGVHVKGDFKAIWFRDPDGNILHVNGMGG